MTIFGDENRLTEDAVDELRAHVDMIECECPARLIDILEQVRAFTAYTQGCIERFPEDADTHRWLHTSGQSLDGLLSATIAQLARYEGFIDDDNQFRARPSPSRPEP